MGSPFCGITEVDSMSHRDLGGFGQAPYVLWFDHPSWGYYSFSKWFIPVLIRVDPSQLLQELVDSRGLGREHVYGFVKQPGP